MATLNTIVVIKHHSDSYFLPQIEELEAGTPGRLKVTAKSTESDEIYEGEYNTVSIFLLAKNRNSLQISLQHISISCLLFLALSDPSG